jgi:hypothetical protein
LILFSELNICDKTTNGSQYEKNYFFTFYYFGNIFFRQDKLTSSLSEFLKGDNLLDSDRTVYTYDIGFEGLVEGEFAIITFDTTKLLLN